MSRLFPVCPERLAPGLLILLALGGCGSSDSPTPAAPVAASAPAPANSGDLALVGMAAQEERRPAPPTSLTATPGDGQVALSWETPLVADGIRGYQARHGKMGRNGGKMGNWTDIEGSDHRTTTHTVTGLENGSEYRFRVRAVYFSGAGRRSERVTATPTGEGVISPDPDTGSDTPAPDPPAPPTGLVAHPAGWDRIYMSWNAPTDPSRTGWQVRFARIRRNIWSPPNPWTEWVAIAGADTTEYTWMVTNEQWVYDIELRAVNASGGRLVGSSTVTTSQTTTGGMRSPTSRRLIRVDEGRWTWNRLFPRARPSAPLTVEIRLSEVDWSKSPKGLIVAGGRMDSVLTRTRKVVAYPSTLVFTPSNWGTPQHVQFWIAEDADAEDEEIIIEYYFTGGGDFYEMEKVDPFVHKILIRDNDR